VILADTSVWIEHFRSGLPELATLLEQGQVLQPPFVRGGLACGNLANRREVLDLLGRLPAAPVATDDDALAFLESRELMGRGIGYVDVHLLAAVVLADGARLWTRDRRLAAVATEMGAGYSGGR
jgi:predicted nucleic acid-binding protein